MMQAEASAPPEADFLWQVGSFCFGDEEIPRIENTPEEDADSEEEDDDEIGNVFSVEKFQECLENTLAVLEKKVEENLAADQEIVFFLSGTVPLHSIEAMTLLLNRIYQIIAAQRDTSNKRRFLSDLETVMEGLRYMKKGEYIVPKSLKRLFRGEASYSLIEAMVALLGQESVNNQIGDFDEERGTSVLDSKPAKANEESGVIHDTISPRSTLNPPCTTEDHPQKNATKDDEPIDPIIHSRQTDGFKTPDYEFETVAATRADDKSESGLCLREREAEHDVVDLKDLRDIVAAQEDLLIPPLSTGSEETGEISELETVESFIDSTTTEETDRSGRSHESYNFTSNYDEALRTINRINLELSGSEETNCDIDSRVSAGKENLVKVPRAHMSSDRRESEVPQTKTSYRPSLTVKAQQHGSSFASAECDRTVDCSLDSVSITDDAPSTTDESDDTGLFNCAFDHMLDIVLGPCSLGNDSDSSISSFGSKTTLHEDGYPVASRVNVDESVAVASPCRQETVPPNEITTVEKDTPKSSLMESDFQDIESDNGESDWWIHDVAGAFETVSLTSF